VSYVLIVQPPEEKEKEDDSGMNVYDFDGDGDVDFGDSDGLEDEKSKVKGSGKRSQTVMTKHQADPTQHDFYNFTHFCKLFLQICEK
jgi:hypothetical protein